MLEGVTGAYPRALYGAVGVGPEAQRKPFVAVANSWSEVVAGHNHLRQPERTRGFQAVRTGVAHAPRQVIGNFGSRPIEHADESAAPDELLHRCPATAISVEDDDLAAGVFEELAHERPTPGGDPEHAQRNRRTVIFAASHRDAFSHAADGRGGVCQDRRQHLVQPGDVGLFLTWPG